MNCRSYRALLLAVLLLSACSGGGSGSTPARPSTATLKLSVSGTTGRPLSGIGASLILPDGVSVDTTGSGEVTTDIVTVTGAAVPGTSLQYYTRPSGDAAGKLSLIVASSSQGGFGVGEFATVTCRLPADRTVQASDFILERIEPVDLRGAAVTGLAPRLTVELE
jgi:hypothetical protein